jgi:hypothetical protein
MRIVRALIIAIILALSAAGTFVAGSAISAMAGHHAVAHVHVAAVKHHTMMHV